MPAADAAYWRKLRDMLADLYGDPATIRAVAQVAGLDVSRVDFAGSATVLWGRVLDEARKSNRSLMQLMKSIGRDYGDNAQLRELLWAMPTTESVSETVDARIGEVLTRLDGLDRKLDMQAFDLVSLRRAMLEWATGRT